jgi:hypothetical protein
LYCGNDYFVLKLGTQQGWDNYVEIGVVMHELVKDGVTVLLCCEDEA